MEIEIGPFAKVDLQRAKKSIKDGEADGEDGVVPEEGLSFCGPSLANEDLTGLWNHQEDTGPDITHLHQH
ncbi:Hypothetical predicted protein [Octopus vulgaris]|uniref:Uncharacterized protein n=1 Tax=Octopus vulgaris TaxID=6645 RepID=A0AA36F2T7_OCTVU|nr:Hypothetical predicted protein [Octopus vulgaris]